MAAFEYFEGLRLLAARIRRMEQDLAFLESAIAPHGQGFGPMGHGGGSSDQMVGMATLSARLTGLRRTLPMLRSKYDEAVTFARHVLYGRSGHGGLARVTKRRGATYAIDADLLRLRYIDGKSWANIARRYNPATSNLTVWCKTRAQQVCREIDRIGMDTLANT